MDEPRVIKKYPNRRLYDTELSKYVALKDLRSLIDGGVEFKVIDSQSGEDITRNILIDTQLGRFSVIQFYKKRYARRKRR